jgi:cytochrome c553
MDALIHASTVAIHRKGASLCIIAMLLAWLTPGLAWAQSGTEATTITLGAPATAPLGQRITVQALLVDSAGRPISKAKVDFTLPMSFLTGSGNMVVAEVITNKDGQAVADLENRSTGTITLRAEFHGDDQYAASSAAAQVNVTGDEQLYAEDIGVHIPLFNAPLALNAGGNVTFIGAALWPSMTGWPIAAVLIIIWSLYLLVVTRIFSLAAAYGDGELDPKTGSPFDIIPTQLWQRHREALVTARTTSAARFAIPMMISLVVLPLALVLLTIGARSPYTQANLSTRYDSHYTRTDQTFVGPAVPFEPAGLAVLPSADPVARGQQLFAAQGCAGCHGLDGRGGIIGPSIVGTKPAKLRSKTRQGPGAMPAFATSALTDDDLAAIAAYLASTNK